MLGVHARLPAPAARGRCGVHKSRASHLRTRTREGRLTVEIVLIAPRQVPVRELPYRPWRRPVFPPLALLTVAALTPPGHKVSLIDEGVQGLPDDLEADLVGITAATTTAPRAYEIADALRRRGVRVVLGGIHATALPEEAAQHADAVVIGEAEGLWPQVVADAAAGELKKFYRNTGLPELAGLPAPRRDLINAKKYVLPNTAQSTRGCPFDCAYCSVTAFFGRTYRTRPVDEVMDEVLTMPPGPVAFIDDNIMGNPRYARELFARLRDAGRKWCSQASVTMLKTPDLIASAAESGCVLLFVGLETLSQQNLDAVGKHINTVEEYKRLVKVLHDHGVAIVGSFMFGLDDDDPDVFDRTVEFALDARIDASLMSILTPLPGTRLYAELERQGRIFDRDWSHYDGAHATFRPAKMTPDQLVEGLIRAVRSFYSGWSIVRRMFQPLGLSLVYWVTNLLWRRYAISWANARERLAVAEAVAGGAGTPPMST